MSLVFRERLPGLLASLLLLMACVACGSEQSKMDRGVVVDQEEAVPGTSADYDMTEAERQAREEAEVEKKEASAMEKSEGLAH